MAPNWREKAALQAEQDRDIANGLRWWNETSNEDKVRVWDEIQKTRDDPMDEIISRMAQVGMTALALAAD